MHFYTSKACYSLIKFYIFKNVCKSLSESIILFSIQYVTDDSSEDWQVLVDDFNPKENGNIYDLSGSSGKEMAKIRIVPLSADEEAEFVTFTANVLICEPRKGHI